MDNPNIAIVPPELDANAVIARIEATMEHFVSSLAEGSVPLMAGSAVGEGGADDEGAATPATAAANANANPSQLLGRRTTRPGPQPGSRSLLASQGAGALAYARGELVHLETGR